jgi:hypothetical protein
MRRPIVLLGNPGHRRVLLFQEALAAEGLPPARVVPWRRVIEDPDGLRALGDDLHLRIESFGEDFEVERLLLRRGRHVGAIDVDGIARLRPSRGRILAPRQQFEGFLKVLDDVEAVIAERPSWSVAPSPRAIRTLFDKRVTSRRFAELGVRVPPRIESSTIDELWAVDDDVFVKLSCGSSASCLALFRPRRGDLITTIEVARDGWYNSLNLRRYARKSLIDAVLAFLLAEGSHVERALPKAKIAGRWFDLRVVTIAGEPRFSLVRKSARPITNLHLGGERGDLAEVAWPPGALDGIHESCRRVAADFDALHLGIDVLVEPTLDRHAILEANAFGDFLPGLVHDGRSVYAWEIAALRAQA